MRILQNGKINIIVLYDEGEEVLDFVQYRGGNFIKIGASYVRKLKGYASAWNYKKV